MLRELVRPVRMRGQKQDRRFQVTEQCRREDGRWRIVVTLPFKAKRIDVTPETPDKTLTAVYRRGENEFFRVGSMSRRSRDVILRSAALADSRHRQRSGYGYVQTARVDGAWPCGLPAVNSTVWRYDGNRLVMVAGDVDEATAVNILAAAQRVSAKTWHAVTDPVKDTPQSALRDPCPNGATA